jgi:nitrilase
MIGMLQPNAEAERFLRSPDCCGGSLIVAPNSRIIAGPLGAEEGILYAECNLELAIQMKLRHDFAGHYNRPDIFHLQINRAAPTLYSVHGGGEARGLPDAAATKLAATPSALLSAPDASAADGSPSPQKPNDDDGNCDT